MSFQISPSNYDTIIENMTPHTKDKCPQRDKITVIVPSKLDRFHQLNLLNIIFRRINHFLKNC